MSSLSPVDEAAAQIVAVLRRVPAEQREQCLCEVMTIYVQTDGKMTVEALREFQETARLLRDKLGLSDATTPITDPGPHPRDAHDGKAEAAAERAAEPLAHRQGFDRGWDACAAFVAANPGQPIVRAQKQAHEWDHGTQTAAGYEPEPIESEE
jgi:hypothetical protein